MTHFIDVGEYGLAFETLCQIVDEREIKISPSALQSLIQLGNEMGISPDIWKGLASQQ